MNDELRQENCDLRNRLAAVIANARYNEERMRRFHEQELRLLGAGGLVDLLQCLLEGHRTAFTLETVTLEPCGYDGDVSSMAELLVANADQAMYRAKQTGRNRVAQSLIKGDRRREGFA